MGRVGADFKRHSQACQHEQLLPGSGLVASVSLMMVRSLSYHLATLMTCILEVAVWIHNGNLKLCVDRTGL